MFLKRRLSELVQKLLDDFDVQTWFHLTFLHGKLINVVRLIYTIFYWQTILKLLGRIPLFIFQFIFA